MEDADDVNRDALAIDIGAHIPASEASFEEEAYLEEEEEEAARANSPQGVYAPDSDEEGELVKPNPMDIEELRGASDLTIEHRFRESIRSFQRFICNHYRIDETIVLTKAHLRKGDGYNQTEMVENRVLKIEDILLSSEEWIQALDQRGRLNDLEKKQLSEVNGYLVTLRTIFRISSNTDIDGNFIFSGGLSSTSGFNIMMRKITDMG